LAKNRLQYEQKLWSENFQRVMGLDEVGRGCLAGPVVAAGVILKPGTTIEGIRDSKKLDRKERERLFEIIKDEAVFWTIQSCSPEEIDELNILWASIRAMQKCVDVPQAVPDYLLVDGNRVADSLVPYRCLVKGDDRSLSIGAASILAKVYRDKLMHELHESYPHFGWDTNVGYPTARHYEGLAEFGYTVHHRKGFNLRTDLPYRRSRNSDQT